MKPDVSLSQWSVFLSFIRAKRKRQLKFIQEPFLNLDRALVRDIIMEKIILSSNVFDKSLR